jgi:hypothetical protein
MKQLLQIALKIYLFLGIFLTLYAQDAILTLGGDASGTGGSASYSVGQVVYTIHTATGGSVAQGVQQAYEISTVLGVEENQFDISMTAFPNPTQKTLTLKIKIFDNDTLSYQLYDSYGRLLRKENIKDEITIIPTEYLAPAIYFLKIAKETKVLKIFKIIKK